ncbi:MAG TPA: hypothetical protein VK879_07905 [Candidatus Sulfomarinibacteraceae bacterium]|nr:hypothetical protein [Candidatus Sulfomarinibacteraceae bacterium]
MDNGKRPRWHYLLLWLIALTSLALNTYLFWQLNGLRTRARQEVANASELLDGVELEPYDLPVHVDETIPISITVPFSDTFQVPISTTIQVSDVVPFEDNIEVPINTVIPINTTVSVPIPAIGNIEIPIPIVTSIPINMQVNVPISRSIPVELDIPVDFMVEVPVESEVPIQAEIPVLLDFPVTLPLDEMGFQHLLQQVQEALEGLERLLGS